MQGGKKNVYVEKMESAPNANSVLCPLRAPKFKSFLLFVFLLFNKQKNEKNKYKKSISNVQPPNIYNFVVVVVVAPFNTLK